MIRAASHDDLGRRPLATAKRESKIILGSAASRAADGGMGEAD
jgi:hypothetical protein